MEMDRFLPESSTTTLSTESRVKSSTRMRFEAEVSFLKSQNGSLEDIRRTLGLSRRKICQLLLVDPSAWTRWTADGGDAPPHIYRALDWYLAIMEKDPEYRRLAKRFAGWLNHEKDHEGRLASLEARLQDPAAPTSWRDALVPFLAFAGGCLFAYFALYAR